MLTFNVPVISSVHVTHVYVAIMDDDIAKALSIVIQKPQIKTLDKSETGQRLGISKDR